MKISRKSWHYRFHNRYYGYNDESKSLCSYIRKIAIALILCIPVEIINFTGNYLPTILFFREGKKEYNRYKGPDGIYSPEFIIITIVYYFIYTAILSTLYFYFFSWNGKMNVIEQFSLVFQIGLLFILSIGVYEEIQIRREINEETEKKKNIFMEYIKAKYRKICPLNEYID